MASTSFSASTAKPAPWRTAFLEDVNSMDSPEFVFSTLQPAPKENPAAADVVQQTPVPYLPRARYCVFRGMWAEVAMDERNSAEPNPKAYETDLPTLTTDVRMQKVFELFSSSKGKADDEKLVQGSGGGGPCEAVWWVKAEGRNKQWRIKGEAFVVGPDMEGEHDPSKESSGVRTVKSEIGGRMRVVDEAARENWSWNKELTTHFGNLSPMMKGSFQAPPPGRDVNAPFDNVKYILGEKVEDNHAETARSNFRVIIIKPEEVERLDTNNARRHLYKYNAKDETWSETETWP